jgi:flavin reductase (DIM6/NTAB) family NADH-FMN oxidoreductase RutF
MDVTAAATLFAWMDREVWLVTSHANGQRGGLIATHVEQAGIAPETPRVLIGLGHSHHTTQLVEASGVLALHLLCAANLDLVWRFGLQSSRDVDKFEGLPTRAGKTGCPLLEGTVGWIECRVEGRFDTGGRTLYALEVVEGQVTNFAPPLRTQRLLELAPSTRLSEMQRQRHHDGFLEAEVLAAWRQRAATVNPSIR